MPEWCSNVLRIEGDDIKKCLECCLGIDEAGKPKFDFDKVIPMPSVLKDTESGTELERGLIILGRLKKLAEEYLKYEWVQSAGVTDVEGLKQLLLQESPDAEAIGRKGLAVFEETGFYDWYWWAIFNWNTKWNSVDTKIQEIDTKAATIGFSSAWSPPLAVIRALSKKFPAMLFSLTYAEPQVGFRGKLVCSAGEDAVNECEDWFGDDEEEDEEADDETDDETDGLVRSPARISRFAICVHSKFLKTAPCPKKGVCTAAFCVKPDFKDRASFSRRRARDKPHSFDSSILRTSTQALAPAAWQIPSNVSRVGELRFNSTRLM